MFPEIDPSSPFGAPLRADVPFLQPVSDDARPVVFAEETSSNRGAQTAGDDRRAVRTAFAQALAGRLTGDGMSPDEAAAWLTHYRETGAIDAGVHDYAAAWLAGDRLPDIDPPPPRRNVFAAIGRVLLGVVGFAFPAVRGASLVGAAIEQRLADVALDPSLRRR